MIDFFSSRIEQRKRFIRIVQDKCENLTPDDQKTLGGYATLFGKNIMAGLGGVFHHEVIQEDGKFIGIVELDEFPVFFIAFRVWENFIETDMESGRKRRFCG